MPQDTAESYERVSRAIGEAAKAAGRETGEVALVAVSKTVPPEAIAPVLAAGHRLFGENRVQEAAAKWPDLRAAYPDLRLHLIGPLQTNKVKDAVRLFDAVETVDRPKLARALAEEMARQDRRLEIFVQVNTGREAQKAGILPEAAADLIGQCRILGLAVTGLMCIPPVGEAPEPHFRMLADLAAAQGLAKLSMGMSADFAAAIRCGATHVRIGTAIFGAR